MEKLRTAEAMARKVYKREIPHILLMHIGVLQAEVMPDLLKVFKKEGVNYIPMSQALKDPLYMNSDLVYQHLQIENEGEHSIQKISKLCL